ncbi:MAG: hypothetical protein A3K60_01470 [Euryarchaeota archaeon RBG_19FT_COMBO_56_21]|nr:MAG: hypothetical protein A3K60_01470 [Euryarchaeota archaeon RBG_19FT_COMBO_56_21]
MERKAKGKKKDWPLILFVSAVAVVAALVFVFGPSLIGGGPEFTVIVRYQTQMDPGVPSGVDGPGNVTITGNITNIGTKGGTPLVHITVWTGYSSETFTVEASPCAAGAHVTLRWVHHFDLLDPVLIQIECEVEALKT